MIYLISNQTSITDSEIQTCSIDFCVSYLKGIKVIGLDIETTRKFNKYLDIEGLDPYTSNIVMLQVGDLENQFVIDTRTVSPIELFPIFTDESVTLVGHNLKFEYKHLLVSWGVRINKLYDTMLVEQILYNGFKLPNSLKDLMFRYEGKEVDKSIRLGFLTIGSRPFSTQEIIYGAEDIIYPLRIREAQLVNIESSNLINTVNLEMRFLCALSEIEVSGVGFNQERWLNTYDKNLTLYNELSETLSTWVKTNLPESSFIATQLDLFSTDLKCNIQWSSSKQVIELFRFLGICPMAVSKTTNRLSYTVEAKEVKMLLLRDDIEDNIKSFISMYLYYKETEQSVTTFGKLFLKNVNPITKRIHSNYQQMVNTGRISSRNPNNQNIPAKHDFRYAFQAASGKVMVNADYSGQENIILVNKSLDPDLLAFYDNGLGDMHAYIASKLFPEQLLGVSLDEIKEKHKDLRQIAKSAGFALAYGGTGFTIASNLGISADRGEEVYNAYFKAFPGLKNFFEYNKQRSLALGFIVIDEITKRRYYFKDHVKLNYLESIGRAKDSNKLRGKMERASQNYVIQGEAGSITKYAAVLLYDWIKANNLWDSVKTVLLVHDEIVMEADESIKDEVATQLSTLMEQAGALWCKRVPLKASAVISNIWEH